MCLGVNRSMWHFTLFAVFFVPDTAIRTEYGAIDCYCTPTIRPRLNQLHQITTKTTNLSRNASG